jgi:hypothetical protein
MELRKRFAAYKFDTSIDTQYYHPNTCFAVRPGEPTLIKILNEPLKKHQTHPINLCLKLGNEFCYLSLVKAVSFRGSSKSAPLFDMVGIQNLAK